MWLSLNHISHYYRKIVAEYEKTIAQMIGEWKCYNIQSTVICQHVYTAQMVLFTLLMKHCCVVPCAVTVVWLKRESSSTQQHYLFILSEDEQRSNLRSQKALHALTVEKEAAMADLNSVERSLSDLFRRYENLKSTVEGFKKVRGHKIISRLDKCVRKVTFK